MICLGAMHPCEYGPHKTLYNRFRRWIEMGVFDKIFSYLTADNGPPDALMPLTSKPIAWRQTS